MEGGEAAAGRLLDRSVTGLVCGSDLMALGAIRAARRRGLDVPRDLSVVGFDDSPLIAFTDPPLTTLRQPVSAIGFAAVRALVDEINGFGAPRSEYSLRTGSGGTQVHRDRQRAVRGHAAHRAGRLTGRSGNQ